MWYCGFHCYNPIVSHSIINTYFKKCNIEYGQDLYSVISNFNFGFELIIYSKLIVVVFVKIYGKEICI